MPGSPFRLWKQKAFPLMGSRLQRVLLIVASAVCFVLGLGYHLLVWSTQTPATPTVQVVFNVLVLAGFGALWALLSQLLRPRRTSPDRIFWTTLLGGIGLVVAGGFLIHFGRIPKPTPPQPGSCDPFLLGFSHDTCLPLTWPTVVKMNLLALLGSSFAFLLLLRFRDLVLVKRSRSSQRNWYLMIGAMILAALLTFLNPPHEEPHPLQLIPMAGAVVLMIVNSLRLSWIVFLSFREKMVSMGLCLLLLLLLVVGIGPGLLFDTLPFFNPMRGLSSYLMHYSFPLDVFFILTVLFGILYCTTALLSLLFHLPTTSDFRQKTDERAVMHSLTHLVGQVFETERLHATICASPVEAGSASAAWLAVVNLNTGSLRPHLVATHNVSAQRVLELVDLDELYADVANCREPLLLDHAPADHRVNARPGDGLDSLLALPLVARDEVLGVLFACKEVSQGFEKDDVDTISVFAAQAALALDNALLLEEKIEKVRLARELSIAREMQRKLLPQRLPLLEGLSVAASSVSAQEVGGDYYDFVQLDDHRLAFIVGDVSGKGTSAAFYMASMQGIFRSLSHLTTTPKDFLHHANLALAGSLEKNVFISVIYGVLDTRREEITLARAGHCPAARITFNGEACYLRSQGLGLGLDRGEFFRNTLSEETLRLQPGDVFVLYTDGVVESRNPLGEEYGYERLLDLLQMQRHEDASDLHDALLHDLNTFIGSTEYDDDLTLVVLKWHGIDLAALRSTTEPRHHLAQLAPELPSE